MDWYRNLLSAGEGTLRWRGEVYRGLRPERIDAASALAAFNPVQRALLRIGGVDGYIGVATPAPAGMSKPLQPGTDAQDFVLEESLGYLVNRLARLMAQQLADELRPAGIGIGQWAVLIWLWERDG